MSQHALVFCPRSQPPPQVAPRLGRGIMLQTKQARRIKASFIYSRAQWCRAEPVYYPATPIPQLCTSAQVRSDQRRKDHCLHPQRCKAACASAASWPFSTTAPVLTPSCAANPFSSRGRMADSYPRCRSTAGAPAASAAPAAACAPVAVAAAAPVAAAAAAPACVLPCALRPSLDFGRVVRRSSQD